YWIHSPLPPDDNSALRCLVWWMLRVLFLGDVVGEPGRTAVIAKLPELKQNLNLDFIVVNGENAAGGRGITGKITIDLLRAGASVVTSGDHIWDQKDIFSFLSLE